MDSLNLKSRLVVIQLEKCFQSSSSNPSGGYFDAQKNKLTVLILCFNTEFHSMEWFNWTFTKSKCYLKAPHSNNREINMLRFPAFQFFNTTSTTALTIWKMQHDCALQKKVKIFALCNNLIFLRVANLQSQSFRNKNNIQRKIESIDYQLSVHLVIFFIKIAKYVIVEAKSWF